MPLLISSSFFRLFLRSLRLIPSRRIRLLAVHALALLVCALMAFNTSTIAAAAAKTYRLKETDIKQPVIWGATCEAPDGASLSFGGEDQQADDGCSHTRVRTGAAWQDIHQELRAASPLEALRGRTWAIRSGVKTAAACARSICLRGLAAEEDRRLVKANLAPMLEKAAGDLATHIRACESPAGTLTEYQAAEVKLAVAKLRAAAEGLKPLVESPAKGISADGVQAMWEAQVDLEQAAEALDAEPPPRAMSPIAYDAKSRLYVVFGGDHLDYLTNDTWGFDPAKRQWSHRRPAAAPPPRAGHQLQAGGDGKIILTGGYDYALNTDYMGGQYKDVADGDWTYDVVANSWSGAGKLQPPDRRTYRTGPFHPGFFLQGPKPDAAAGEALLAGLPSNTWVERKAPQTPRQDRDWGTIVLDTDRDQILLWSGGHCAHGGTDVLHYHLASGRWELPYPVEFPLGQLYSNTSYPSGFNFNLRPWVTGHTYQNYQYDPVTKQLLFTGQHKYCYFYDPDVADWTGRVAKPAGMVYNSCFYTLTLCATPQGPICWTQDGKFFRFDAAAKAWTEIVVTGKLPGSRVDYSTVVYDSKRGRLVLFRGDHGKDFDGQVYAFDLKGGEVSALAPGNMTAARAIGFGIDRACYEPQSDLVIMGALLPPDAAGFQRTPAYDCAANRWISLKLRYGVADDKKPLAPRSHSSGLVYDARRKLIWGVDTHRVRVYVLRLDPAEADMAELKS
jgi:hypothetical protein